MAEKQTQTAGEQLSPPGNKIVEAETSLEAEKKGDAGDQDPLQNLPEDERRIIERQVYTEDVTVGYFALYRYASRMNLVVIFISAFGAIAGGALLPLFTIIFGQLTGTFQGYFLGTVDREKFNSELAKYTLYFVYLAIGQFVTLYIGTVGFVYTGERIAQKVRERYLEAILGQNIGYFDKIGAGEVTTRITADTNLIQDAISQKVGLTLQSVSTFITAFVIGFILYWKLTLILSCTVVAITLDFGLGSVFLVKWSQLALNAYALGGTVAEEVFSSVRNAVAFGTQDKLAKQYGTHTTEAEKWGIKSKLALAVMIGGMFMFVNLNYGLAFWMGSRFVANGEASLSDVITVLFAIVFGAFGLGSVGPNVQAFTSGTAAARKIYGTIARKSPLDPYSDEGEKPADVVGTVELRHVRHIYPSRPEVVVMDDVSITAPAGKVTALVGSSGSGKSTIIGLIERFYDPVGGEVLLDGRNIGELNLRWLRRQMALVSQEPVLFAVSVYENIRYGLIGSPSEGLGEEKVKELVINAAKMANAHDFITSLPEGYETNVGERGFLMSGGQKQRIAIARAVISDPKILLLDEATSALDTKSEGVVQHALDRASQGRTTIVIAHRLSTIRTADNIVVMSKGRIVEQGTHDELLKKQGTYSGLVMAQEIADSAGNKGEAEASTSASTELTEKAVELGSAEKETAVAADPEAANPAMDLKRTQSSKSVSSIAMKRIMGKKMPKYSLWTLIKFIFSFNKKEWAIMSLGFAFSVVAGVGNPVAAILLGNSIQALSLPPEEYAKLRRDANYWSRWYLFLGIIMFFAYAGQLACFGYCAEKLTHRARDLSFRIMLRQDISFFDLDENNAGSLTSFLSTETTYLEGLSGSTLGSFCSLSTTIVVALAIGIGFGWKLGLVCGATIPLLLACGFFRFWILGRFEVKAKKAYQSSAGYACEATSAVRTVASLTRERDVWANYHAQLDMQGKKSLRSVLKSSLLYAAAESFVLLVTALGFWYGGTLIASGEYSLIAFFITFSAIIFSAQGAGTAFSFAPDFSKAIQAAALMKKLFDRQPEIDVWSDKGNYIEAVEGSVEFRDVHFRYPTRPEQPVLRGLSLTAKPGQYVALVGASGCGKSTVIALVERFYDPVTGSIHVDGQDTSTLNLKDYRNKLALVSQEPTLYQGTIRDNILLGTDLDDVPDEAVVRVCKEANIYDFIMSLPDGFNTLCGTKGTLLSGGQKQRIAIARALIRDPKILLLDEATSALDSESEKVVQAALDAAARGRTTIVVAHRLSTIQNADVIYVLDGGKVIESGKHNELLERQGRYFELVQLQSLRKVHQ